MRDCEGSITETDICGQTGKQDAQQAIDMSSDDDEEFEEVPAYMYPAVTEGDSEDSMPELGTVELTVGESSEPVRKRRAVVTRRARMLRRSHHMVELICQQTAVQFMSHICNTQEVKARCLSLIPGSVVERIGEHQVPGKREIRRDWASADLHCFLSAFQALKIRQRQQCQGGQPIADEFGRFVERRTATQAWHQPMLLVSMLRLLTFDARLCVGLNPPALKLTVQESVEIERCCQSDIMLNQHTQQVYVQPPKSSRATSSGSPARKPGKAGQLWSTDAVPQYWCEVFNQVSEQWTPINAYSGTIERATQLTRTGRGSACAFAYILAVDGDGHVCDVTQRYSRDFVNVTQRQRLEGVSEREDPHAAAWWAQWLERWAAPAESARAQQEAAEMARRTQRSTMPRRLADFAHNPYYVLQRNLAQNEVIYPAEPIVGTVRGEHVFLRANVQRLRSQMAWLRMGRSVEEDAQPIKTVRQRAATARARQAMDAEVAAGREPLVALFGEWQTRPIRPPPVADGRVPRNDFGRVDLFTPAMLPAGAAHIRDPDASHVCTDLGIDCVPAVVGFDFRRGVSTPVFDGFVVPLDAADIITDALRSRRHEAAAQERADREQRAVHRWRRLLVALRVRAEVDATFATRSAAP
ncbi:hypothetical protein IWW36_001684 [Coemansia brasiliensis]|uniref:Rad4-domain-containing protein n=1 Tax=Coemansia brasiliensis TaxID=2650707 RepID=A0A9W8IG97_9FUNG|nr:hypothetical protein IWW36_001684 [Coemansia brasiliensis]